MRAGVCKYQEFCVDMLSGFGLKGNFGSLDQSHLERKKSNHTSNLQSPNSKMLQASPIQVWIQPRLSWCSGCRCDLWHRAGLARCERSGPCRGMVCRALPRNTLWLLWSFLMMKMSFKILFLSFSMSFPLVQTSHVCLPEGALATVPRNLLTTPQLQGCRYWTELISMWSFVSEFCSFMDFPLS